MFMTSYVKGSEHTQDMGSRPFHGGECFIYTPSPGERKVMWDSSCNGAKPLNHL